MRVSVALTSSRSLSEPLPLATSRPEHRRSSQHVMLTGEPRETFVQQVFEVAQRHVGGVAPDEPKLATQTLELHTGELRRGDQGYTLRIATAFVHPHRIGDGEVEHVYVAIERHAEIGVT